MLFIIPRSGVIGLLFAILPVMAGFTAGSLIASLIKGATTAEPAHVTSAGGANTSGTSTAQRPAPHQIARQTGSAFTGFLCALLPLIAFHVAAWAVYRKAMRDYTTEQSPGYWRGIFGGAYAVGFVMGLILLFSM